MGRYLVLHEGVEIRGCFERHMSLDEGLIVEHETELPTGEPVRHYRMVLLVVSAEILVKESLILVHGCERICYAPIISVCVVT